MTAAAVAPSPSPEYTGSAATGPMRGSRMTLDDDHDNDIEDAGGTRPVVPVPAPVPATATTTGPAVPTAALPSVYPGVKPATTTVQERVIELRDAVKGRLEAMAGNGAAEGGVLGGDRRGYVRMRMEIADEETGLLSLGRSPALSTEACDQDSVGGGGGAGGRLSRDSGRDLEGEGDSGVGGGHVHGHDDAPAAERKILARDLAVLREHLEACRVASERAGPTVRRRCLIFGLIGFLGMVVFTSPTGGLGWLFIPYALSLMVAMGSCDFYLKTKARAWGIRRDIEIVEDALGKVAHGTVGQIDARHFGGAGEGVWAESSTRAALFDACVCCRRGWWRRVRLRWTDVVGRWDEARRYRAWFGCR
ncbi:uncharacterized protein B0I36DRAFT_324083 [Microdochium trichocladiopsis]|uniref:Uncharacterized protein n=1 Tax=Microdochium trichocladiopsis TaxID=1682393 RepID=A0A9P8Y741_9PEZI|nr:uncharacterized protein B0I36DRAFT_324083 [Microdochium trichocladiopsis]KAH7031526.1 hypothetical protein B0I36DRAFT_324083 [Microdochium trichocladiopsis]